jgi:hypothetical protein
VVGCFFVGGGTGGGCYTEAPADTAFETAEDTGNREVTTSAKVGGQLGTGLFSVGFAAIKIRWMAIWGQVCFPVGFGAIKIRWSWCAVLWSAVTEGAE